MKTARLIPALALIVSAGVLRAATVVETDCDTGMDRWHFTKIPGPSRSDAGRDSHITISGGHREASSLSPDGLHVGVMPWKGINKRDAFAFSDHEAKAGAILMDLGSVKPVAAVATYSWQQRAGGQLGGMRSKQRFTLYGSAAEKPDPADASQWTKIADVDTRSLPAGARHGSFVKDDKGGLLGDFRWVRWQVSYFDDTKTAPNLSNTWFTELDVHTPETLKTAGDAAMAGENLDEIVLAFKTHFDIGFTHRAKDIVAIYRTSFIDRALALIDASQKLPPAERFVWTLPSWAVEQLLWSGQNPARRERIVKAMKQGSLVMHAMPVSLESEGLDLEDLVAGLSINTTMSKELGLPLSRAGKMTDVPCQSWAWATIARHAGIDFFHIGCNPCCEKPDLPLLYRWEGPDGSRILVMHNEGYGSDILQNVSLGSIYPPKDWPYKHWLALNCGVDNSPPPSRAELAALHAALAKTLPGVKVKLGKMEDFSDGIAAEEKAGVAVPVVHADEPDPWIHGDATMPAKDALAHRAREMLFAAGSLDAHLRLLGLHRPDIAGDRYDAYENLVMFGEHTWGGAVNLQGRNAYADKDFAKTVETDPVCRYLQTTWNDKAAYAENAESGARKLTTEAMSQLANAVNVEGPRMVVFNPLPRTRDAVVDLPGGGRMTVKNIPASGYTTVSLKTIAPSKTESRTADTAVLENAFLKVTLDRAKGGIVSIIEKKTGRELTDPKAKRAFGQYAVHRFSRKELADYTVRTEHLASIYGRATGWFIRGDLPANVAASESEPAYATMTVTRDGTGQSARLETAGASMEAEKVTTTVTLPENSPWLEIALRVEGKRPDYWPENDFLDFGVNAEKPQFRIGRLGAVTDPAKDFVRGSNRTYGYVNTGAIVAGADGHGVAILPLDAGLMSFGDKGLGESDPDFVPATPSAKVDIFNNIWTINFPYWMQGELKTRVRVWPVGDLAPASLTAPAIEAMNPVLTAVADGPAGTLPARMRGLAVSRPAVRVTNFSFDPESHGMLLRLWEQGDETGPVEVTLPESAKFTRAQPVTLRGEKSGASLEINDGKITFTLNAYSPASFILE